jgi:hypothetical protein
MIRWLFILLFIYIVFRLIQGPKNRKKKRSNIRFRFGDFTNQSNNQSNSNSRKRRLDDIEDAEFEDITEKTKKENNS